MSVVIALLVIGGLTSPVSPKERLLTVRNLGDAGWQTFVEPESVTLTAAVYAKRGLSSELFLGEHRVNRFGEPKVVRASELAELRPELAALVQPARSNCAFQIDYMLEMVKGNEHLSVATCFTCGQVAAFFNGRRLAAPFTMRAFPNLRRLVESRFTESERAKRSDRAKVLADIWSRG